MFLLYHVVLIFVLLLNKVYNEHMENKESMKQVYPLGFGEEVGNCISHGVMGLLLLFALPYYAIRAYIQQGALHATGISIYIICMIFMFMGSCLYHSMPHETTHKYVFRKIDHIMILLAIAGTYTPICLSLIHNWVGYVVLAIEWVMAIFGILLKSISSKAHPKLSMCIYMVMGWLAILILPTLLKKGSPVFLALIVAGGLLYTAGTFFYSKPQKRFFHFTWHIFILLASICHMIAIFYFL